jgi:hypothetical protein
LSYPLYIFVINYLIAGSMILGRRKLLTKELKI